jgi:hypothetical protein
MAKLTPQQRQKLAAERKSGASFKFLMKKYNCSQHAVRRWAAEGLKARPHRQDGARAGRPPSINKAQRKSARAAALRGKSAASIAGSLSRRAKKQVSSAAVRGALKHSKCPMHWAPKNRGRRLSPKNKKLRQEFCAKHKGGKLKSCLFADSKMIYLYKDGTGSTKYVWLSPGAKPAEVPAGNPYVVHIYGLVGKGSKSPLIFTAPTPSVRSHERKGPENFSSKHFIKVAQQLHTIIKQWGKNNRYHRVIWDHAKQHTSQRSRDALQDMGMFVLEDFPPQSWDLNIIENCWGVLDTVLSHMPGRTPTSIRGWRLRIERAWDSIEQSTIDQLVSSIDQRIADVEELGGAWCREKAG